MVFLRLYEINLINLSIIRTIVLDISGTIVHTVSHRSKQQIGTQEVGNV